MKFNVTKVCRAGAGTGSFLVYSKSEIAFYLGEVTILDGSLKKKREERVEQLKEQEAKLPTMQNDPLEKFLVAYAEAEETLKSEQGLGRKYGAPRRDAQEKCRTMMSRTANSLHSIGTVGRERSKVSPSEYTHF